jgi:hypothetical protein
MLSLYIYRESLLHNQWDITISYYTPFMMDIINNQWAMIYYHIFIYHLFIPIYNINYHWIVLIYHGKAIPRMIPPVP